MITQRNNKALGEMVIDMLNSSNYLLIYISRKIYFYKAQPPTYTYTYMFILKFELQVKIITEQ